MPTRRGLLVAVVLLTVLWIRAAWRHFIKPPSDADFDWGMTHGFYLFLGLGVILACWGALVRVLFHD